MNGKKIGGWIVRGRSAAVVNSSVGIYATSVAPKLCQLKI